MGSTIARQAAKQAGPIPLSELGTGLFLTLALAGLAALWLPLSSAYVFLALFLYALLAALVGFAWHRYSTRAPATVNFGWANRITLLRALPIVLLAATVPYPEVAVRHGWLLALLSLVALVLDGVDGAVARKTGSSTSFGSRFDMELDAFFILALAALVASMDKAGLWVLSLGLIRYGFVLAGRIWPRLQRSLPDSFRRKTVCVWQIASLLLCLTPPVTAPLASVTLVLALMLLIYSFVIDMHWLARQPLYTGR